MLADFPNVQEENEENLKEEETKEVQEQNIEVSEESETETEESNTDEEKPEEPSSQNTKDSPLTPYAKMLVEEGVLPNLDLENFDGTADSLMQAYSEYDQKRFEQYKESYLDPRVKWLQDNLEEGVPLNKLLEIDEKKFELSKVTEGTLEENEDLQRTVVKNYYKETTNFTEEKIDKLIERLETLGELESESKSSLSELKTVLEQKEQYELEQSKRQRQILREQEQKVLEEFNNTIDKTEEIIPGIKLSSLIKDRIIKTLTTPVDVDPQTGYPVNKIAKARSTNPLDFEIKLAYLFELTKGFQDWSSLGTAGKRKAIEEFEESIKSIDYNKGGYKPSQSSNKGKSYLEEMEKITKLF